MYLYTFLLFQIGHKKKTTYKISTKTKKGFIEKRTIECHFKLKMEHVLT